MDLFANRVGNGDHLIILHGLFGSGDNWWTLAKRYGESFDTHVLDLRNHGRSDHDPDMSYDLMAADVGWYMSAEQIDSAHIVGHSMGGKVAMWLALQHPNLVNKLVVADIAPREHPPGHEDILTALCSLELSLLQSREQADEQISDLVPSPSVRQFLLKNLTRSRTRGFEWKMNLPAIREHYDLIRGWPGTRSQHSSAEALFLVGTRSDYITIDDSDEIAEIFPRARFVDMDAGHWLHAERPDEFFQETISFLTEA